MITIEFTIHSLPKDNESYRLITNTEGNLTILHEDTPIFSHNGILLVEFARQLNKWLDNNRKSSENFFYNSMDFEEDPVIAFKLNDNLKFYLESTLTIIDKNIVIEKDNLLYATKQFLQNLQKELISERINLEKFHSFDLK